MLPLMFLASASAPYRGVAGAGLILNERAVSCSSVGVARGVVQKRLNARCCVGAPSGVVLERRVAEGRIAVIDRLPALPPMNVLATPKLWRKSTPFFRMLPVVAVESSR